MSTLRACIAPHVALESALGPPSTTQRPFNNTLRACIAPYVELENTLRPHDIVPLKDHSTALIYTVEQHPESLYSPSRTTQESKSNEQCPESLYSPHVALGRHNNNQLLTRILYCSMLRPLGIEQHPRAESLVQSLMWH